MSPRADELLSERGSVSIDERTNVIIVTDERRVIALAFFDGLTHVEIAAAERTPVGTIKARIRRGMLKLKPTLARLGHAGHN